MKCSTLVFAMILVARVASAQGDEPNPFAGLQKDPTNKIQLESLKSSITTFTNDDQKCHAAIVYMLGCMLSGDAQSANKAAIFITKNYPCNPVANLVSPAALSDICSSCTKGFTYKPCEHCRKGMCQFCRGGGNVNVAGALGACPYCGGTGKCKFCKGEGEIPVICDKCNGKGSVFSLVKAKQRYMEFLARPLGQTASLLCSGNATSVVNDSAQLKTRLIQQYSVPHRDLEKLFDQRDTSIQIAEKIKMAIDPHLLFLDSHAYGRGKALFYEVPQGLDFVVTDITDSSGVNMYAINLELQSALSPSQTALLPPEVALNGNPVLAGGLKGLKPVTFGRGVDAHGQGYDSYTILLVAKADKTVMTLKKGDKIKSDGWVLAKFWMTDGAVMYRSVADMQADGFEFPPKARQDTTP